MLLTVRVAARKKFIMLTVVFGYFSLLGQEDFRNNGNCHHLGNSHVGVNFLKEEKVDSCLQADLQAY